MSIKKIVCKDTQEIANLAAQNFIEIIKKRQNPLFILATGSSPILTYKNLINDNNVNKTSWRNVRTFNLDEYVDLKEKYVSESYRNFMNINLFNHIDIDKKNTFFPSKNLIDGKYDDMISDHGVIDLAILGIGNNGHIAFNEPGTSIDSKTHIAYLDESTRLANSRFFNNKLEDVPHAAVTMGLSTILKAKKIILIATGTAKKNAILHLCQAKEFDPKWPCTCLVNHQDVTIYIDRDADLK